MKNFIICLFIFSIYLSCRQHETIDDEVPAKVNMVLRESGYDTLEAERGIDAVANTEGSVNYIQLMWYSPQQMSRLSHFNIYRGEAESGILNFLLINQKYLNQPNIADTLFIDAKDLELNTRYYYYVTAVNKDNHEGAHSDTVSYKLMEKAISLSINGNATVVSTPMITFGWSMGSGFTPNEYIMRIERFITENFHPLVFTRYVSSTYQTPQFYGLEGDWLKQLFGNGRYRWRVDCVGPDNFGGNYHSGSESDWFFFTVNWSSK